MTADNRRVKMTKRLIKDAYIELLDDHDFGKVSVTEICKNADINRSTFYSYYRDTDCLHREIENDVISRLPIVSDIQGQERSRGKIIDMLERLFSYIRDNQRLFRVITEGPQSESFKNRIVEKVLGDCGGSAEKENAPISKGGYIFCIGGVIGLLKAWLDGKLRVNARQCSEMAFNMSCVASGNPPVLQEPNDRK